MDVEILSRLQFAGTIMFHYLFPPLSIGLGLQLFLCELMYVRTKDLAWEAAARFWTRVFAVNFAMGVATGIVSYTVVIYWIFHGKVKLDSTSY
jgi:cytochrome d ubiquinol oxidase subunit I